MLILTFAAPSRPLSENESRRLHWATRSRRLKDWGLLTSIAWRKADENDKRTLIDHKIQVKVRLPFSKNARRDPHNYIGTNVKTIIDALVKEGMCLDDTSEYIEVLEPGLAVDKQNEVIIYLNPIKKIKEKE
jgi:hypothetical protein